MNVQIEQVSSSRKRLKIEVPHADLQKELDAVYQHLGRQVKVPGFRSGKIPRAILEKRFKEEAKGELLKKIIPQAYSQAVKDHDLKPVGHPKLDIPELKENEPLCFEALFDIQPEVKLGTYIEIPLKQKKEPVSDEELNQAIENLRQQHAQYQTIDSRPLQMNDFAILDWQLECEGKVVESVKERWVQLVPQFYIPKFCEPLVGAQVKEKRDISVLLPEDYPDEKLRKKEALFHVEIKEIKEKIIPELNDDFAKDLGQFESLEQVQNEVRKHLESIKEKQEEKVLKSQVVDYLLKNNKFDLPGFLVDHLTEEIHHRGLEQLKQRKVSQEELESQKEKLAKLAKERAETEVKLAYIIDEIAKAESIQVGKEDMEHYFRQLIQSGQNPAYLEKYFRQPENLEKMREQLKEEKVLQFLVSKGKITQ